MKHFSIAKTLAAFGAALCLTAPTLHAQFVYETDPEFITTGDFNGDGMWDIAIVDRYTGRVRIGFRVSPEFFNWSNWRASGMKSVSGVTVGKLTDPKCDSLALTSSDGGAATIVDAKNPNIETDPIKLPVKTLGADTILALDIGGAGNTPLLDLYVESIYNADPTPTKGTLFRNASGKFTQMSEVVLKAEEKHANRVAFKTGGPEYAVVLAKDAKGNALHASKFDGGKPEEVLVITGVPNDADYVVGNFRAAPLKDFVFYVPGESELMVSTVEEAGGKLTASALKKVSLKRPLKQLLSLAGEKKARLLAIFADAGPAEVMDFDGSSAPVPAQSLLGITNRTVASAITLPDAVVLFSPLTNDRPRASSSYQVQLLKGGSYAMGIGGNLAPLDDRDDSTVPDIHTRIVANLKEKVQADMKAYTNVIPGSEVEYAMVPIPGGEFVMGSPGKDKDKDAKEDEAPQHKVKISPFWMGKYEVTWDQYLLFQYVDDELKMRETHPGNEAGDKLSDAVTRPSKPYPDMSFGMGRKAGLPVISMTQHAANKFCHWLSAKTGQFYRLPTEAEWEYACRAGTTTRFYFGDDESQLKDYAWYFENSNSSYQKVGKKKPNAWGLYDMYGNVGEWVLDQYDANYYQKFGAVAVANDPWNRATQPYPHSVRGGSFDDDGQALRSAARFGSTRDWKATYPQLPKSIWHLSDWPKVGFRIVRPLTVPSAEDMAKYWISTVEKD